MSRPATPRGITNDVGRYYALQAAVVAGGLISMPITTRLLSQAEYGRLSLVFAFVSFGTVVGQLGFANAIARFYAERESVGPAATRQFCEAVFTGALVSGSLLTIVLTLTLTGVFGWSPGDSPMLLTLAGVIVATRVLMTVLFAIYRSRQSVGAFAVGRLACQWGIIVLATTLLLLRPAAATVLAATAVIEGVVTSFCFLHLRRLDVLRRLRWSSKTLRQANSYGWPLAFAGAAAIFTAYADRFLIERYLGVAAVAQYSVPYDLSSELARTMLLPIQTAVLPAIFRLWAAGRKDEVRLSLSVLTTNLLAFALPIGALFAALNGEIITLLASAKYHDSAALTVYLLPGVLLNEMTFLFAIGLRLSQETRAAALISVAGAGLNIAVNVVTLPRIGLAGAAAATSFTYLAVTVALYFWSRPVLRLRIRGNLLLKSALVTALMLLAVRGVGPIATWLPLDIAIRGCGGAFIIAACLIGGDGELRRTVRDALPTRKLIA